MNRARSILLALLSALLATAHGGCRKEVAPIEPPATGSLDMRLVPECSGFARSKKHAGVYWTHSDARNAAAIVAIRADGSVVKPPDAGDDYRGVQLAGTYNFDWEAICFDPLGNLVVVDMGNNTSRRNNLGLLVFPEPDPTRDTVVKPRRIPVKYGDQEKFPDPQGRFDCEAAFYWHGEFYALTKRRSDSKTMLYKLALAADGASGVLRPVTLFDSHGMVTDAALSPDEKQLVVLTYHNAWVFDLTAAADDNPLSRPVRHGSLRFPTAGWQVEAVAFLDDSRVIIGAEQGVIYTLDLALLPKTP